jgi:hypothetical protein
MRIPRRPRNLAKTPKMAFCSGFWLMTSPGSEQKLARILAIFRNGPRVICVGSKRVGFGEPDVPP